MVSTLKQLRQLGKVHVTRQFSAESRGHTPIEQRILDFSTLGDALFQEQVNRIIAMCHKRMVGAVAMLDRIPWTGDAYHVMRQTPVDSARFVDDTDNLTSTDFTGADEADYAKTSFPVKFLLVIARVTRHAQVRGRNFADLLALETAHAVEALTYKLEEATFTGDETANAKEFDGFFKLLEPYNGTDTTLPTQLIVPSNGTLATSPAVSTPGDLTLELMDKLMHALKPSTRRAIFAERSGARVIWSLLQSHQAFRPGIRVQGGFIVDSYQGAPIMPTDKIPLTLDVVADGSGNPIFDTVGDWTTEGTSTAVVACNLTDAFYAEWTPITVVPVASGTSQVSRIDAYLDITLALDCPEGAAAILNIKSTV